MTQFFFILFFFPFERTHRQLVIFAPFVTPKRSANRLPHSLSQPPVQELNPSSVREHQQQQNQTLKRGKELLHCILRVDKFILFFCQSLNRDCFEHPFDTCKLDKRFQLESPSCYCVLTIQWPHHNTPT